MVMMEQPPAGPNFNVLSQRYATSEFNCLFSEYGRNLNERLLWIAVMKAQKQLGVNIPSEDIEKFERAAHRIDPEWIENREAVTRHDVKAKIEAFVAVANAGEYIHKGMTSRDLTDNVEQMQNKKAATLVLGRTVSVLRHIVERSQEYKNIVLAARTHHQVAQATTVGRRLAMIAEELMVHLTPFETFINSYQLRGIKGPVGTQSDMISLLGSAEKVDELERLVAKHLGFENTLHATGQVYPRSMDLALLNNLSQLMAAPRNFAIDVRLMAGYDLLTEGFKAGQVGSSAMPYKMNTRSAERVYGLSNLVKMYAMGAALISGDQWEEADVSCSTPRRIILTDSFYAVDGICETMMTVLNEMGVYGQVVAAEVAKYSQFLTTTAALKLLTEKGMGREQAHEVLKQYTIGEALAMRQQGTQPDIAAKVAADPRVQQIGVSEEALRGVLRFTEKHLGNAKPQTDTINQQAKVWIGKYAKEAQYEPQEIL